MASYCETCEKIFDGKWDNCPECGNVAKEVSPTNIKIDTPKDKKKKSVTKETVPSSKSNNRDNKGNDFAFIGGILRDMHITLERLDRKNLSEMNEHLWWLSLGVQLGLIMLGISIILLIVSLG